MHLANALRHVKQAEAGDTPATRPNDFWEAYASRLLGDARCRRMEIRWDVLGAAGGVLRSRPSTVANAFHLARPPSPVTWLEWVVDQPGPTRRRGWLLLEQPDGTCEAIVFTLRSDDVVTAVGVGLTIRYDRKPSRPIVTDGTRSELTERLTEVASTSADALAAQWPETFAAGNPGAVRAAVQNLASEDLAATAILDELIDCHSIDIDASGNAIELPKDVLMAAQIWQIHLVGLLLLLNSRNAIELGDAPDLTSVNRARAKKGKQPLVPVQALSLDVTRRLRAARRAGLPIAPTELRERLAGGHFKLRGSGLFWWSRTFEVADDEVVGRG